MLSKSIVDPQSYHNSLLVLLFILGASLLNLMECYSLKLFGHLSKTPIWPRFGPVFGPILVPFWSLFGTWYLQMTSWQSRLPFEGSESDGIFSSGGRIKSPQCTPLIPPLSVVLSSFSSSLSSSSPHLLIISASAQSPHPPFEHLLSPHHHLCLHYHHHQAKHRIKHCQRHNGPRN